jgi:hypothetical protein
LPEKEELLAICEAGKLDKNCFNCKSYWTSSKDKTMIFPMMIGHILLGQVSAVQHLIVVVKNIM